MDSDRETRGPFQPRVRCPAPNCSPPGRGQGWVMSASKPIAIVGGGLAGLALGIGLRQRGVPATVWEAARYPRHRVCGEFISGRGLETLARLDLRELILRAGATPARTAAFFSRRAASRPRTLPSPALCVSRFI